MSYIFLTNKSGAQKNEHKHYEKNTQRAFVKALLELLIEVEYEKITITDLCEKVGVVRKTFYNNFSSKDDIVYFAIDEIFLEFKNKMYATNLNIIDVFRAIYSFAYENRESMLAFYKRGLFRFAWESIIKRITEDHILSKIKIVSIISEDHKYIAAHLAATLISIIETWINNDFLESVDHLANLTEFLLNKPKVLDVELKDFYGA